ncbi:hypothetical protein SERLADRAFT_440135 [Serpula lacrymans var. lacrymans S7.9]|uniref:Uncharacterized protein n=1 Tax=Serpula lacrymans var. lacrymans (strain S7.9) TaxID=578457 RepID=F8P3L5_SERL9|nr:uncharacterized protein SERLADRAFT_440135 [Serpula lacrymans var. lacrymans S7.9]EGO22114.1 hypothetical protein SERLADRAFT_440135 [Serpula lacrymans var. lacrymans S7.9]
MTLLGWCSNNGIRIDSRIRIIENGNHDGDISSDNAGISEFVGGDGAISVWSRECIESPATLVHIPKSAVLSVRSCSLSQLIAPIPYGNGAHLALALALYGELLRDVESRWFGYLQSLPREIVDIALFWGVEDGILHTQDCTNRGSDTALSTARKFAENLTGARGRHFREDCAFEALESSGCSGCDRLRDGLVAREWLRNTEIEREVQGLLDEVRQYYFDIVEPTLRSVFVRGSEDGREALTSYEGTDSSSGANDKNGADRAEVRAENNVPGAPFQMVDTREITLAGFYHAYSLVSSRAFLVDAYHGLAMVPIADAQPKEAGLMNSCISGSGAPLFGSGAGKAMIIEIMVKGRTIIIRVGARQKAVRLDQAGLVVLAVGLTAACRLTAAHRWRSSVPFLSRPPPFRIVAVYADAFFFN